MPPCSENKHDILGDKEKYNEHFCELIENYVGKGNMINAYKERGTSEKNWVITLIPKQPLFNYSKWYNT